MRLLSRPVFDPIRTVLMPCWGLKGGEDVVGDVCQTRGGCEAVSVEVDGDVLERFGGSLCLRV